MHVIFFGLKRAWHSSLRTTRRALATMGLTAARFDLLYVLEGGLVSTQRQLRRTLGVNRTTVSRMLGSLESLGLVTRGRVSGGDRRTRAVSLTDLGRRRIRLAVRSLMRSGAVQLLVDSAIGGGLSARPGTRWYDEMDCLYATEALESLLRGICEAYGDFATLYYPWHPDD